MTDSWFLLQGWTFRSKELNGGRQIVAFHIAGDFADLNALLLKPVDHTVTALGPATLARVPHNRLHEYTRAFPHLTRMLWLSTLIDAAITRAWLTAIGRFPASGALAHLICETAIRLEIVGQADAVHGFRFPVQQSFLGEALDISAVHVNRSIRDLREGGAATWARGAVRIDDWNKLVTQADFDPSYLHLQACPR